MKMAAMNLATKRPKPDSFRACLLLIALLCGSHMHAAVATPSHVRPRHQRHLRSASNPTVNKAHPAARAFLSNTAQSDLESGKHLGIADPEALGPNALPARQLQAASHGRTLKIPFMLIFAAISSAVGTATTIADIVKPSEPIPPSQNDVTVVEKCENCCFECTGNFNFGKPSTPGDAPPPPPPKASINGCDNESCLCTALGPGVHPNIFDSSCGTFSHCPGPKKECGPGTVYNVEINNCDYPVNAKCSAVQVPAA